MLVFPWMLKLSPLLAIVCVCVCDCLWCACVYVTNMVLSFRKFCVSVDVWQNRIDSIIHIGIITAWLWLCLFWGFGCLFA